MIRRRYRALFRSKKRLHLTRDGKVVPPGHPDSARLLVAEGGELSDEDAQKYGLLSGGPETSDVLPLDSKSTTTTGALSNTPGVGGQKSGFPESLHFGTPPASGQTSPQQQPEGVITPATAPPASQPQHSQAQPTPEEPVDLPADFPYRQLLVNGGFGNTAKIKAATKEQLINIDQIGSNRADEIIAAREKL
jgi:hypothetical protein